ncbi:Ohr family peroxiredoxin [Rubrobacter marinus]|uniref:Ohr family peroxiredoxin n=1 Tax=Rubrobacter marinus TaxID=2653852 RepID=A0A6G8PU41_9ACTN|nr:organic hydroperoxide resistance protein [Rubrobacter marinus]QIN77461.1 Ohr family peroxiredoxin [Rubrobacter marinus]
MQKLYSASATVEGGRQGHVASSDGVLDMDLAMPKGLGGQGTNPEQLFAAGYAACFESAIRLVARQEGVDVNGVSVTANVDIGHPPDGGFALETELVGRMPSLSREEAEQMMEKAHQVCPYSRATRGNMPVKLRVEA